MLLMECGFLSLLYSVDYMGLSGLCWIYSHLSQNYLHPLYPDQRHGVDDTYLYLKGNLESPVHLQPCFCEAGGNWSTQRKPSRNGEGRNPHRQYPYVGLPQIVGRKFEAQNCLNWLFMLQNYDFPSLKTKASKPVPACGLHRALSLCTRPPHMTSLPDLINAEWPHILTATFIWEAYPEECWHFNSKVKPNLEWDVQQAQVWRSIHLTIRVY